MPEELQEQFGFIPKFTRTGSSRIFHSLDECLKETGEPAQVNFAALNVFLRSGLWLNGETPFLGISRVLPPPEIVRPKDTPYRQLVEAYIELFRKSVAHLLPVDSVIALSGGKDSRHILFELHRANQSPEYAITADMPWSPDETSVAAQLATATGIRHVIIPYRPSSAVEDEIYKNRKCNYASFEHRWAAEFSRQRDHLALWDGIAGDVLSESKLLQEWNLSLFEKGALDELTERIVDRRKIAFVDDQTLFPAQEALDAVRRELEKHREAANPVGSFYFWNRTRINIGASAFGLFRPAGQRTLTPYLERDLWNLLAAIPARLLLERRLHSDVIREAFPEFAHIPYAVSAGREPLSTHRRHAWQLLRYCVTQGSFGHFQLISRALRCLVSRSRAEDAAWLLPQYVYLNELRKIAVFTPRS
jgi:asparagine synthase (glutamine-hydrolysing)